MASHPVDVEIRLFGHAYVSVAGTSLKIAKRNATLAMLAYLILQRGAPVSRASLAFIVFPEEPEDTALAELRRYLYLTAKALPAREEPWFVVEGETVRWNTRLACRVDVLEFERLAQDPATYGEAVALYGGDLLADVYDDWVLTERERLRMLHLTLLENLIDSFREQREFARALSAAQSLLALDPWREDVVRKVMGLRYSAGDSAGALAEAAAFANRLRDELGVAPMPETLAIRDAISNNAPIPGEVPRSPRPATAFAERRDRAALLPFVGRIEATNLALARWSRAARGEGSALLVRGEAGVGKSRFCAEIARRVDAEGGRVYVGGTAAPESLPYQALLEALRSALPLVVGQTRSPARAAALTRVLPELLPRFENVAEVAPAEPERESGRIRDALAEAVVALARPRPLLLILEDLHWAGSATLEAFAALARRVDGASILVLATCREEDVGAAHPLRGVARALATENRLGTLELGRLRREDVAELARTLEAPQLLASGQVERLFSQTEGNPLFLNELIADTLEGATDESQTASRPNPTIGSIVAARTARLSSEARTVVEIAAVAGSGCSVELAAEVAALPFGATLAAFNELLDRRIVREASSRSDADYVFTHHLIAASVYAELAAPVRARRHARIAHVLERGSGSGAPTVPGDIARHFDRAGLNEEAARWYATAALQSAAVYAGDEAVAFASRALELQPASALRRDMLRLREALLGQRGDRVAQRVDIEALAALLAEGDVAAHFDVLRRRASLAHSLGDADVEREHIAEMELLAERSDSAALRAEALRQRAALAISLSRQAEAREPAEAALHLFEELHDGPGQVACLGVLVNVAANLGERDAVERYLRLLGERASSQTDRRVHIAALHTAAVASLLDQRYRESHERGRELIGLAQAIGDRDAEGLARGMVAVTAVWLEDFALAGVEFDLALGLLEETGNKRAQATILTNYVLLAMRLGRFEEAERLLERSNSLLDIVQERRMAVANANNLSFVRLQLGDAAGAERLAQEALEGARAIEFPVFEAAALSNLGNAQRARGDIASGLRAMEAGLELRRRHQASADFADDLADLTIAYVDAGRNSEAAACARELAQLAEEPLGGAFWPHYALWAASRGFAAGGSVAEATALAERAEAELLRFAGTIPSEAQREAFLRLRTSSTILGPAHAARTLER